MYADESAQRFGFADAREKKKTMTKEKGWGPPTIWRRQEPIVQQRADDRARESIDACVKEIDKRLIGLRMMLHGFESIQETSQEDYYGTTRDGDNARANLRGEIARLERYRSAMLLTKSEL